MIIVNELVTSKGICLCIDARISMPEIKHSGNTKILWYQAIFIDFYKNTGFTKKYKMKKLNEFTYNFDNQLINYFIKFGCSTFVAL